jgi:hypothetical protein
MDNTLAFWQEQILSLNSRHINSEIPLADYRKGVEALFRSMGWQKRIQCDTLAFS